MSMSNGAAAPGPEAPPAALQRGIFMPYGDPKVSGKAQPLTARVLTPSGWKLMGDLVVGDAVVDPDGGEGRVEGVFPQGARPVHLVKMEDGGVAYADEEHLWVASDNCGQSWLSPRRTLALAAGLQADISVWLPGANNAHPRRLRSVAFDGWAECTCIAVSTKRNLYITDDYIVTHNTTLLLRAFPRALFIGRRDAIQPIAEGGCGFTPQPWQFIENITTLVELATFLSVDLKSAAWQAALKAHGITALVVDDVSQLASKSVLIWRNQNKEQKFFPYNMLDQYLDTVSYQLADLGMLCGLSAHKTEPKYDQNEKSRNFGKLIGIGAPEMPSKGQVQAVPGWATLVAPVRNGTASLDPWWPKVLSVDPTSELWISGDRNSVCWDETPANLREVLRAARTRYDLPRLQGLEWQDETADVVAEALDKGEPVVSVIERIFAHYGAYATPDTPGEKHVQWAVQDGIARHTLRARRKLGVLATLRASAAAAPPPPPPAIKG